MGKLKAHLTPAKRAAWPVFVSAMFELVEPTRFRCSLVASKLAGQRTTPLLVLSDGRHYTSEQQLTPLVRYRGLLRRRFGIVIRRKRLKSGKQLSSRALGLYDVVGLMLYFRTPTDTATHTVETVRGRMRRDARLVYFDGDDDLCILWPQLMPLYDLYVKKHCFRDRNEYLRSRVGKTNLTDYVSRVFGVDFSDNEIKASDAVGGDQVSKVRVGWNIAFDRKIQRLSEQESEGVPKTVDVLCRASVRQDWTYPLRAGLASQLESLSKQFTVITPTAKVPQKEYIREMLAAKICVSPFGYGEICWRDFEAVLCGCVLVKPDMSHVETYPDIFVPGMTYIPVEWDYSNLADVVRELLADPERCEFLRANALAALRRASDPENVVTRIASVLGPVLGCDAEGLR